MNQLYPPTLPQEHSILQTILSILLYGLETKTVSQTGVQPLGLLLKISLQIKLTMLMLLLRMLSLFPQGIN
jgi:hypothetical protein